jgi:hypothetical protein
MLLLVHYHTLAVRVNSELVNWCWHSLSELRDQLTLYYLQDGEDRWAPNRQRLPNYRD